VERLLRHEEISSLDQKQSFSYSNFNREQEVVLVDSQGLRYRIVFTISKDIEQVDEDMPEKIGKRLLVGKFVLFDSKPAFVKNIYDDRSLEIMEVISKRERKVRID